MTWSQPHEGQPARARRERTGHAATPGRDRARLAVAAVHAGDLGCSALLFGLIFGISPLDLITFAAVPVVMAAATVLASYLTARRATWVDPVEVLKAE